MGSSTIHAYSAGPPTGLPCPATSTMTWGLPLCGLLALNLTTVCAVRLYAGNICQQRAKNSHSSAPAGPVPSSILPTRPRDNANRHEDPAGPAPGGHSLLYTKSAGVPQATVSRAFNVHICVLLLTALCISSASHPCPTNNIPGEGSYQGSRGDYLQHSGRGGGGSRRSQRGASNGGNRERQSRRNGQQQGNAASLRAGDGRSDAGAPRGWWVCPFFRLNPRTHFACLFKTSRTITHLQQHIERCHCISNYCPDCWSVFQDEPSWNAHFQSGPCPEPPGLGNRPDSFTEAEFQRKFRALPFPDTQDGWDRIWRIVMQVLARDTRGRPSSRPALIYDTWTEFWDALWDFAITPFRQRMVIDLASHQFAGEIVDKFLHCFFLFVRNLPDSLHLAEEAPPARRDPPVADNLTFSYMGGSFVPPESNAHVPNERSFLADAPWVGLDRSQMQSDASPSHVGTFDQFQDRFRTASPSSWLEVSGSAGNSGLANHAAPASRTSNGAYSLLSPPPYANSEAHRVGNPSYTSRSYSHLGSSLPPGPNDQNDQNGQDFPNGQHHEDGHQQQ
ncbi:hypothetical protein MKZ38_001225 [Zalerion maritima]|uniref:C2H2-type domain-containing protein n=1 Tax=Zalerion maritima TaxID=339359 RepID=A0AAD5RFM7_9PEZI|nr:hypothetical protein MKZ38_001225 [Zalerion maritima]